jgi:perosamine synthetase
MSGLTPDRFVGAMKAALVGHAGAPLHEPFFPGREREYLAECMDTRFVSSVGAFVDRIERQLEEITGCGRAIAVVNGTAAVTVTLRLAGVEAGDEVLIPALTFVAAANAAAHLGARPHFVDSEPATMGIDPKALQAHLEQMGERRDGSLWNRHTGRRIAGLVVVHILGHPSLLDGLAAVCADWGIPLVEDASEALGSYQDGKHVGRWGVASALSFNGNKIVTTGGGGAVLTEDVELGDLAKHLSTTAKRPHAWEFVHDQIAWNFRMPNLNAAVGCAQLERLDAVLGAKRRLAARYGEVFGNLNGVTVVPEPAGARSNLWLNAVRLDDPGLLEPCLQASKDAGFGCRPLWKAMHELPMYRDAPRARLPVAVDLVSRTICLPSSENLAP